MRELLYELREKFKMKEIKIKINNQLKIEELNNIRKKFKLP